MYFAIKIILLVIFCLFSFSCSFFSSNSFEEHIYDIKELSANFIVLGQDTTTFSNGEFFNYCVVKDSIDRKFLVLEDGCSSLRTMVEKVEFNDTIFITIRLSDPKRFEQNLNNEFRRGPTPERILFIVEGGEVLQIYQSDMLCNHHLYLTK
jgi:hypothetical protein